MSRVGAILSSCALLLWPALVSAQSAQLEICNNGRVDVDVAVAARIQLFITGYRWKTIGWYAVAVGSCSVVYDEDYDDAGPYTPQSGARIALTSVNAAGKLGAFQRSGDLKQGWIQGGTGQLCVQYPAPFTFERPAGDPSAGCTATLIPVAADFLPEGPGKYTYTLDWDGVSYFVPLGKARPSGDVAARTTPVDSGDSPSAQFLRYLEQQERDSIKAAAAASTDADAAKEKAALLQSVREDVAAYVDASRTGFEAFKSGEGQRTEQGAMLWTSRVKPALADGCWVIRESAGTMKFYCQVPLNASVERAYYTAITDDVTASLPAGWSADAAPPFNSDLPSKGYRSTSGAHGEIWLVDTDGAYELRFDLVAAGAAPPAASPEPVKADDDDPIGAGGFITPPSPKK